MKRLVTTMGFALALSLSVGAAADPSPQVREQVQMLLRAPEYTGSEADWKAIGPEAAEVLREVVADDHQLANRRGRAALALAYFPGDETRSVLTAVAASDAHWVIKGKVARTLAASYGAAVIPALTPLLADDHKRMREAAIKAFGLISTRTSRQALEARLPKETNASLQKLIRVTAQRIAAKEGK